MGTDTTDKTAPTHLSDDQYHQAAHDAYIDDLMQQTHTVSRNNAVL